MLNEASRSGEQWDALATIWDGLQGDLGDIYRRHVIHPYLLKVLNDVDAERTVCDVGCGNGATLRLLAQSEPAVRVIGIDASARLLDFAAQRHLRVLGVVPHLVLADLDSADLPTELHACADVAVVNFTLQDVRDLDVAVGNVARMLSAGGRAEVVVEDHRQVVGRPARMTTQRVALSDDDSSTLMRERIYWTPEHYTVTTHWSRDMYVAAARRASLELVWHDDNIEVDSTRGNLPEALRSYAAAPSFAHITLVDSWC
jgi:ubiquinone/menaquinone biosynthesis C-methylase UbiE